MDIAANEENKVMDKKEIKQFLDQGYLQVNIIFEIVGNPEDYVSNAIRLVMKKVEESKSIKIISQEIAETIDVGEGLFGTNCEAQLLVKDLFSLSILVFTFIPSSLEIIEPKKLTLKDKELSDLFADIITQLHNTNTKMIQTNSTNMAMLKNINALMRNTVLASLEHEDKTGAQLAKSVGVKTEDVDPLLKAMITEKTIEQKGNKYSKVAKI
jgi:hypothetical protein